MKKKIFITFLTTCIILSSISGCGRLSRSIKNSIKNNQNILIGVDGKYEIEQPDREKYDWEEVDSTNKYSEVRGFSDSVLGIISFGNNSKNGVIFVDKEGNWVGNTYLRNAYNNEEYIESINNLKEVYKYRDVNSYTEWMYKYFNLGSAKKDGSVDFKEKLTRVEAMAIIARACNSVKYIEDNEIYDWYKQFNFAEQAYLVDEYAYINRTNGSLDEENALQNISNIEIAYIIYNMFFSGVDISSNEDKYDTIDCERTIGVKGDEYRDYYLEYCIQTGQVDKELVNAWKVFEQYRLGYASAYEGITIDELMKVLDNTFLHITNGNRISCSIGKYETEKKIIVAEEPIKEAEEKEAEDDKEEITIEIGDSELILKDYEEKKDIKYVIDTYEELGLSDEEKDELIKEDSAYTFLCFRANAVVSHTGGAGLNVRIGPAIEHRIISCLEEGTKVKILGRCDDTEWYIVEFRGKIYFQCDRYLELVE